MCSLNFCFWIMYMSFDFSSSADSSMNAFNPSVQSQSAMPPSHNPSLPQHVTSPASGAPQQNFQYTMSQMDGRQFYPPQPQQQPLLWNQWYDLIVILFLLLRSIIVCTYIAVNSTFIDSVYRKLGSCIVFFFHFVQTCTFMICMYRVGETTTSTALFINASF